MTPVEELSVAAVRSAMAPGFHLDQVGEELLARAQANLTALRLARARVERGAGWRAGPIGQRARDALTRAIELGQLRDLDELDEIDLTDGASIASGPDLDSELDDASHR